MISLHDNRLAVKLPAQTSADLLGKVRNIDPRRTFDPRINSWTFPAEPPLVQALCDVLHLELSSLPSNVTAMIGREAVAPAPAPVVAKPDHSSRLLELQSIWPGRSTPYNHQLLGLGELLDHPRWLLAWEMGTGKSAPTAARIRLGIDRGEFSRVLIACPKNVIAVWPEEILIHGGLTNVVVMISGDAKRRAAVYETIRNSQAPVIAVTNYETVRNDSAELAKCKFGAIVCDEAHRAKTLTSQTSKRLRKLSQNIKYRWALSGTPAPNGPLDICGTLCFLDETILGTTSITALRARYAIVGPLGAGHIVGYRNLDELNEKTARVSSRVLKEQCLDLPPKTFITRKVSLGSSAAKVYEELKEQAVAAIVGARSEGVLTIQNVLTESLRLLQVCGGFVPDDDKRLHLLTPNVKLDMVRDLCEDLDRPTIIWAAFVAEVKAIASMLKDKAVTHHGGMDNKDRLASIAAFKAGEAQFFVSTPSSAREGLTLTNADTVIYYSRNWNLLDWSQSQDRAHRISQTRPVTIVSLVATGTVDEKVAVALEKKISLQELILKGKAEELF